MTLKKCSAALSICLEHFVTLPLPCAHTLCLEHRIATHLNPSSVRSRVVYIRTCRKRSALLITDTDERLIASAAKSGLSNTQVRLGRPMRAVCPPRLCRHSTKATAKRCGDTSSAPSLISWCVRSYRSTTPRRHARGNRQIWPDIVRRFEDGQAT